MLEELHVLRNRSLPICTQIPHSLLSFTLTMISFIFLRDNNMCLSLSLSLSLSLPASSIVFVSLYLVLFSSLLCSLSPAWIRINDRGIRIIRRIAEREGGIRIRRASSLMTRRPTYWLQNEIQFSRCQWLSWDKHILCVCAATSRDNERTPHDDTSHAVPRDQWSSSSEGSWDRSSKGSFMSFPIRRTQNHTPHERDELSIFFSASLRRSFWKPAAVLTIAVRRERDS